MERVSWPPEVLRDSHQDGCTEPWIAEVVASLLIASGAKLVVELGGFIGTTSTWLAFALLRSGGGELVVSEPDEARANTTLDRLAALQLQGVSYRVARMPSPQIIHTFSDKSIGFVWVDDEHTKLHVEQEINALWPKMAPLGIMCFHDVWGVTDLQSVVRKYGGIALDLPRLGPAGGLGIIQVPNV